MLHKPSLKKIAFTLVLSVYASGVLADEKIEGVVTSTKMTVCKFQPGGCAGSLVLDVQRDGRTVQVPIQIPLGTPQIKKGNEIAYLPALRGNMVSISHKEENGEKIAKAVEVIKPAKP